MRIPTGLRGAAAAAALAATERLLPDAVQAARIAQIALDTALAAGHDTAPFRQALAAAIQQKKMIHAAITEKQAQIDQRREDKINAAAGVLIAAANTNLNSLLQQFTFEDSTL